MFIFAAYASILKSIFEFQTWIPNLYRGGGSIIRYLGILITVLVSRDNSIVTFHYLAAQEILLVKCPDPEIPLIKYSQAI